MDVDISDDEQPDTSRRVSSPIEQPSGSLENSEESYDGLNQPHTPQPGPSNAMQGSQDRGAQSSLKQQQESKELIEERRWYSAGHLKKFLHGNVYQLRLLMLYLHRGLKNETFSLATEMLAAGKFDDVVLRYQIKDEEDSKDLHKKKDDENKKVTVNDSLTKNGQNTCLYSFLQAKHQGEGSGLITSTHLLADAKDAPFGLPKYFNSYLDIERNPEFNTKIKDFTIFTNMGLDPDLEKYFDSAVKDDILADLELKDEIVQPSRFKLKQTFLNDNGLAATLRGASDFNLLTTQLTDLMMSKSQDKLSLVNALFGKYHLALEKHVIAIEDGCGKFSDDFINKNLDETSEVGNFRIALREKCDLSEDDFKKQLKKKKFQTTLLFGKNFKLKKNPVFTRNNKKKTSIETSNLDLNQELAKEIVDLLPQDWRIVVDIKKKNNSFIWENRAQLAGHVFVKSDGEENKFRQGFLDDDPNQLPERFLTGFREALKAKRIEQEHLDRYKFKFNIYTCTEEDYGKYVLEDKYFFDWLTCLPHKVTDKEIIGFLGKLIFAVNQPNADELGEIIKRELGEQFNLCDSEFIVATFQNYILNWMKQRKSDFLTHTDSKIFFDDVSTKLAQLKLIGVTKEYCSKIDSFGITFSEVPSEITDFLNSKKEQIFNLVCPHSTTSGSIKVRQALQETHKEDDSKICLLLSSLLLLQTCVIEAFNSTEADHLLVIECDAVNGVIDGLFKKLSKLLKNAKFLYQKKVILITQENDALAEKFETEFQRRFRKIGDEKNSFSNLTEESRITLLSKRKMSFQKENISLGKLMEITDVKNLSEKELYHLNTIIDPKALVQLIKNEDSIKVGIKQPDLTDLDSIYYIASATITIADFSSAVENNSSDLFFIGGTTKEKFSTLFAKEEVAMRVLGEGVASEKDRIIILDDKDEEKNLADFKRTCSEYINTRIHNKRENISAHLIEIINDKLYWKRTYDQSFYIKRYLYHVEIKKDFLKTFIAEKPEEGREKKDIFAISSIKKSEFGIEIPEKISLSANISTEFAEPKKNHIMELKDVNEGCLRKECFKELCSDERLKYYNIHWLQNKDNKLLWRRSKGKMNKIQTLKAPNGESAITHNLNDITGTGQPVVIAGEPGMGKSTALMQFIKQLDASEWIIKLNLINLEEQLKKLSDVHDLDGFIEEFFSKIGVGVEENLAKQLLKYRIEHQGKITLFFDGFDEVADENQEAVIKLLKHLKNTKAKILITTRLSVKDKLENALSVFSYTFQPFADGNQIKFLQNFWKASFKLKRGKKKNSTFDYNFSELIKAPFNIVKKNELMSIPVLIRMFAEIYQEIVEKYCYSGSPGELQKDLSRLDLYNKFIERKYAIYFKEKINMEKTNIYIESKLPKCLNKDHQRLAFRKLFPKLEHTKILADEYKLPSKVEVTQLKLVGIIQSLSSDGDLHFIHQTFAEYFAAGLLFDGMEGREDDSKYKEVRKFLLTQIFRNRNKVIRDFLDKMILKEGGEIEKTWETIQDCDLLRKITVTYNYEESKDRHDAASEKSLGELTKDVYSCMDLRGDEYSYKGEVELITKLFRKFLKEKDIEILKTPFMFIIEANENFYFSKEDKAFTRNDNVYNATKHYLLQANTASNPTSLLAKQQNKLDYQTVIEVFTSLIPNFETFKSKLTEFNSSKGEGKKKKLAEDVLKFLQDKKTRIFLCFFINNFCHSYMKYISTDIKNLNENKAYWFLEGEGIKTVLDYEFLTPQMSGQFCSILDKPIKDNKTTGWDRAYAENIFHGLVIPIVERMKKEKLFNVNRLAFLKLFVRFTQSFEKSTWNHYSFTTEQLSTILGEFKKLLEAGEQVHMALCQITEYLFMLAKAGLKVITLNVEKQLLVLDPASEFQCEILSRTEQIVELIKWKLQNPDATRDAFLQECYNVVEPTKRDLKRRKSD